MPRFPPEKQRVQVPLFRSGGEALYLSCQYRFLLMKRILVQAFHLSLLLDSFTSALRPFFGDLAFIDHSSGLHLMLRSLSLAFHHLSNIAHTQVGIVPCRREHIYEALTEGMF